MAVGDIFIRRNEAITDAIPNAGSTVNLTWDVEESQSDAITYNEPFINLQEGTYLIMYSEEFYTTNTTNNERIEINSEIHVNGQGAVGGFDQGYIRKASGHQRCTVHGYMIHQVAFPLTSQDIFIQVYRTDNSTTGTVNRVAGKGALMMFQLDPADGLGIYKTQANELTSGVIEQTLQTINVIDQTGGITNSSGVITVPSGFYVLTYTIDLYQVATGREEIVSYISKNGTANPVNGSYASTYLRGGDGCQDGGMSNICLVEAVTNDTFQVRYSCPTSAQIFITAGKANFSLWRLPDAVDKCIIEATTGDFNINNAFTWDTIEHIDTNSFTATAGTDVVTSPNANYYISFANLYNSAIGSVQRGAPAINFQVDGNNTKTAIGDVYHRNSGGTGRVGLGVGDIFSVAPNSEVKVNITANAASGSIINTNGQWGLIALNDVYGPYDFPLRITSLSSANINDGSSLTIYGSTFGTTQGTGYVELWSDSIGTLKVSQTPNTWSDNEINITVDRGTLVDGVIYVYVENDTGKSDTYNITLGFPPYDAFVEGTGPDHGWTMDNTYDDDLGNDGTKPCNATQVAPIGFDATPLCRSAFNSLLFSGDLSKTEVADSQFTNVTNLHQARDIGGWIMVDRIQQAPTAIYEEGGGVNNLYFILGFGNILLANIADSNSSPNVKVQAFSDFTLAINRPYHILMHYESTAFNGVLELYIDGIKQSTVTGPVLHAQMSTHSGDWSFGRPDGTLDTGGTDIQYPSAKNMNLGYWATWSAVGGGSPLTTTQIRESLFETGTLYDNRITTDTVVNMQADMATYNNTTIPDYPCAFQIDEPSDSDDLTITLDDMVFDDRVSIQIQWIGAGKLTIINSGTSNVIASKVSIVHGGTFEIQQLVPIKYTIKDFGTSLPIEGVRCRVLSTGGDLPEGTVLVSGLTDSNGEIESSLIFTNTQDVVGVFRNATNTPYYKQQKFNGSIFNTGLEETILLVRDQ
jgi:hypothetical protein